jgi:tetratricopeptide (TPR) repeat protein
VSDAQKLVLSSPEDASTLKDLVLWAGLILVAVLTVYSPALRGTFVWDDNRHVAENRNLRDMAGLARIWTRLGLQNGGTPQYYPLTHTTFWMEYRLWGAQPAGYHVDNAILHAAAAVLLWFVLRTLQVRGAWIASAIFALHPIQAESVAWISERKNVLAAVFSFAALLAYLKGFRVQSSLRLRSGQAGFRAETNGRPDRKLYALSLALFLCAVLSKTVACVMPAVLLVLIWWKRGKLHLFDILPTLPFFLTGLAMGLLTAWIERTYIGASGIEWNLSLAQRVLIAGHALWFYVAKLLWPAPLMFIYPKWNLNPREQWIYPAAVLAVVLGLFLLRRRIGRGPAAAAAIFCIALSPALGFFNVYPMRYSYVADHFQYLAGPALIVVVVGLGARLLRRLPTAAYAIGGTLLIALAMMTFMRTPVFAGMIPLWRDTIAKNPSAWMARYNLAKALYDSALQPATNRQAAAALLDEAAAHLQATVELKHDHDRAYYTWGQVLMAQGKTADAIPRLQKAIEIEPRSVQENANLGLALQRLKSYAPAADAFQRAAALAPNDPSISRYERSEIHRYWAECLEDQGRPDEAETRYAAAIGIGPESATARFEYGTLLARRRKLAQAASQFAAVAELQPRNVQNLISLALVQIETGKLAAAQANLATAVRIDPNAPRLRQAAGMWNQAYTASTRPGTRPASRPTSR